MDELGIPKEDIISLLKKAKELDLKYEDGMILGSMCTSPHDFSREVFSMFMESNLGDAGLFSGTKNLEGQVIASVADLLGMNSACGAVVTGGTEANILALWAARERVKKKRIILPETAHFSLYKACSLLGLEKVKALVDKDKCVDLGDVESKIDAGTCAIVGIAGTTEYGTIDDIKGLSEIAQAEEIDLHVDAAFGGFVLPFLKEMGYPVRFEPLKDLVSSVTVDPHKMGLVPIPCGCIAFRDSEIMRAIETKAPYLTKKEQYTIVGSRSGASAASAYALFKLLGREGYRKIVKECMENTIHLYNRLSEMEVPVRQPTMNILTFNINNRAFRSLTNKGWRLSTTLEGETRVIIMPHVLKSHLDRFLSDLKDILRK